MDTGEIEKYVLSAVKEKLSEKIRDSISAILFECKGERLLFNIKTLDPLRAHDIVIRMKNPLKLFLGKNYRIGLRGVDIESYDIEVFTERKPVKKFEIPFATLDFGENSITVSLKDVSDEFISKNYPDRIIKLVKEKVDSQYYEGKKEKWNLLWYSGKKNIVYNRDPSEEMIEKGWLVTTGMKGKWFYRPPIAKVMRTMVEIAVNEVLSPLNFQEVIEPTQVPFDVWLKTGHLVGMPNEIYYISEPITRDTAEWERFVDTVKITRTVNREMLRRLTDFSGTGICYAQCPNIYASMAGKTISEDSFPLKLYERTAVSSRYEAGGRHGIERVDEFHRIEPVYIGKPEHLMKLKKELQERYEHVFNDILDLEWRMASVTPFYLEQAGINSDDAEEGKGTIDFESYLPYRGNREESKWLEFQNLSIVGDKYTKAFNIKSQSGNVLWSGCTGIGIERWAISFLAQHGLDIEEWPESFVRYFGEMPSGIKFM